MLEHVLDRLSVIAMERVTEMLKGIAWAHVTVMLSTVDVVATNHIWRKNLLGVTVHVALQK